MKLILGRLESILIKKIVNKKLRFFFGSKSMFFKNINRFTIKNRFIIPKGIILSVQFGSENGEDGSINTKVLDYYIQLNITERGKIG